MSDPEAIGRYKVLRRLGVGGMGAVYLARSPGGLNVAIKVIRHEFTTEPQFRTRFRREIEAVRAVSPLYTAPIVDSDAEAEMPWFATVYLDGESVAARVERDGPLPADAVRALAAGCAEALAAIHAAGLVHRDITPSNVLLLPDGPRIIDFGIARQDKASALTVGYVGTIQFASPEHFDNPLMGPHSDIYSLGATLCYAATGHGPAGEGSTGEVLARVLQGRLDLTGLDPAVHGIVEACLRLDPAERPTASALLDLAADGGVPEPVATAKPAVVPKPVIPAPAPPDDQPKPVIPTPAPPDDQPKPADITRIDQARTTAAPGPSPSDPAIRGRLRQRRTAILASILAAVLAIGLTAAVVWWPPPGRLSIQSFRQCAYRAGKVYVDIAVEWSGPRRPKSPPTVTLGGDIAAKATTLVAAAWTGSTAPFISTVQFSKPGLAIAKPAAGFMRATLAQPYYNYAVQVAMSNSPKSPCPAPGLQNVTWDWHPF